TEDISAAQVIFGLKEIEPAKILSDKTYLFFSHTHKGQIKNRSLLQRLVAQRATLIDYELIVNAQKQRIVTAFTYFAGYAGMVDSMWAFGQRMQRKGIDHPFATIPQSVEKEDLDLVRQIVREVGETIKQKGTPADLPPLITCFLGTGKTSTGARDIYHLLPVQSVTVDQLPEVFARGDRHQVYELLLDIPDMYRLRADSPVRDENLDYQGLFQRYLREPEHFESNMATVFPYCSMMMNCILWDPKYPRLLTREDTRAWYAQHDTLQVIGDITCDPEGAIQFSQETWIDDPVFIYRPEDDSTQMGFEGEGIAVMAVTNLPCEYPADASQQFSADIQELLPGILAADYKAADPAAAGLPEAIQRATILWRGAFTPDYAYMEAFLS
ncbi:MAG: hypothetical protein D6722_24575, partial [Bacteroidetes bacterium]